VKFPLFDGGKVWDELLFPFEPSTSVPFRDLRSGRTTRGDINCIISTRYLHHPFILSCEAAKSKDRKVYSECTSSLRRPPQRLRRSNCPALVAKQQLHHCIRKLLRSLELESRRFAREDNFAVNFVHNLQYVTP
jgi:hypothetical protein